MNEPASPKTENLYKHSGQSLTINEIIPITLSKHTKIIVLAGPPECGKTTILAFLYNIFQKEEFNNLFFAGSKTLIHFDRYAFHSKIISGLSVASTERTKIKDTNFLHLELFDNKDTAKYSFLITDISGERFNEIKDSEDECKNFGVLTRCDSFCLLFNGEDLINIKNRNGAKTNGLTLLRNCIDSQMIDKYSYVDILFTKFDLIKGNSDAESFLEDLKKDIQSKYGDYVGKLKFFNICARSTNENNVQTGLGIDTLLRKWINDTYFVSREFLKPLKESNIEREFLKYRFHNLEK